jgi:hypothetical protein
MCHTVVSRYLLTALVCSTCFSQDKARHVPSRLPVYFEKNLGQAGNRARFIARAGSVTGFITADGITLSAAGEAVTMRISGANPKSTLAGEERMEGISNYYFGNQSVAGLAHWGRVRAQNVHSGVDVVYHANGADLEYDLLLHSGARSDQLRLRFEGGDTPKLSPEGDILIKTKFGMVRQRKPRVWQEIAGKQVAVDCNYYVLPNHEVGLLVGKHDRSADLTIDPILSFSTYLGGTGIDQINGVAVDSTGVYVAGSTSSTDFPTSAGLRHDVAGLVVTKLNPSGTALVYSTVFGDGSASAIAVDSAGNAYVGGTAGTGFPDAGNRGSGAYALALKLDPAGVLVFKTVLVSNPYSVGSAIAVDQSGSIYLAGTTDSPNFPVTPGAFRTTFAGPISGRLRNAVSPNPSCGFPLWNRVAAREPERRA